MNLRDETSARRELLKIFSKALGTVQGQHCVAEYLSTQPLHAARIRVVAIGKAAASMLMGAQSVLGHRLASALLITKYRHLTDTGVPPGRLRVIESGHPYPDANSLLAGQMLLEFIAETRTDEHLLFLISGGTSALVEVLPTGVTLEQLAAMNRWLLASGWPIDRMNQCRRAVSCIKGGRLARYLGEHAVTQLLLSDVPDDDPAVIGSGLLVAQTQFAEHMRVLPEWVQAMCDRAPPPPDCGDPCFAQITTVIVASNQLLRDAVGRLAAAWGLPLRCNEVLSGEATDQGHAIAARLTAGAPGLYLWGGETVVTLPASPGLGGRCQQLALAAACDLASYTDSLLLAAGTDGTDGPGEVAGALVDGQTLNRGRDAGLDPEQALAQADAGRFLQASGDLLDTGPTGTNVMDLVLGLKWRTDA